jgi:hypothetical protein
MSQNYVALLPQKIMLVAFTVIGAGTQNPAKLSTLSSICASETLITVESNYGY